MSLKSYSAYQRVGEVCAMLDMIKLGKDQTKEIRMSDCGPVIECKVSFADINDDPVVEALRFEFSDHYVRISLYKNIPFKVDDIDENIELNAIMAVTYEKEVEDQTVPNYNFMKTIKGFLTMYGIDFIEE